MIVHVDNFFIFYKRIILIVIIIIFFPLLISFPQRKSAISETFELILAPGLTADGATPVPMTSHLFKGEPVVMFLWLLLFLPRGGGEEQTWRFAASWYTFSHILDFNSSRYDNFLLMLGPRLRWGSPPPLSTSFFHQSDDIRLYFCFDFCYERVHVNVVPTCSRARHI